MEWSHSGIKKFFLTLIAFAVWSALFDWKVTLIIMSGLWIHGMGHILVARYYGMSTSGIYFIPLIGAVEPIGIKQDNLWQMAMVSLAGPFVGVINTAVLYGIGKVMESQTVIGAAGILAFINLFNLIPLSPLDGGRAIQALLVSSFKKAWLGMIPLGGICFFVLGVVGVSPFIVILLTLVSAMQIKREFETQEAENKGELPTPRVRMNVAECATVLGTYLVLVLVLTNFFVLSAENLSILFSS